MSYTVFIERGAQRALSKVPREMQGRIDEAIDALADNPRPPLSKKLQARNAHRIHVGDWRVIYEVDGNAREVTVVTVAHRNKLYKRR